MSENKGVVRHIPNILTLLNLCCGFLALYFTIVGEWETVCWLIGIAGLADLLDGLVARALNVSSPIGAQLDSLADMISFGVVPGMVLFSLLMTPKGSEGYGFSFYNPDFFWYAIPALLFPICAALRLARFNVEDDSAGDFRGLSTPAATALIIGFILYSMGAGVWTAYPGLHNPDSESIRSVVYFFCFIPGLLMVADIRMFSLKFKGMGWKGNEIRYIFILIFVILLFVMPTAAILTTMILYIVVNTILHNYRKMNA